MACTERQVDVCCATEMKTVLVVTYGGGHARMVAPIVERLKGRNDIRIVLLALTTAQMIFDSLGIEYRTFKDYLTNADKDIRFHGQRLLKDLQDQGALVEREESIAYLGASYVDLLSKIGEANAAAEYARLGRLAFCPTSFLERIFDVEAPDFVVVTNSPRAERAAVDVANSRGIRSLAMVDLFGIHHFYPIQSTYVSVLSEFVIDNMRTEGVEIERTNYWVTGNPAFDFVYSYKSRINKSHGLKRVLWADMPAYWDVSRRELYVRTSEDILRDLNDLLLSARHLNFKLVVRPHPSQHLGLYKKFISEAECDLICLSTELEPLAAVDGVDVVATYTSTLGVEAVLLGKPLVQLKNYLGPCDVPLGEMGMAYLVENREHLHNQLRSALYDTKANEKMRALVNKRLPTEACSESICERIISILND